ncbi:hypothetical protein HMPREF9997_01371 [Corynebacterium durum F0235]|uniref:Uncharacterized protein n=1 Tax=Corynebacterium durum F0235 TaxID=1035195 RepID=L1MGV1_9CORY|nr:hypothetical protein HMPREF9997_01371 [Corynebacterium durum F0235]
MSSLTLLIFWYLPHGFWFSVEDTMFLKATTHKPKMKVLTNPHKWA